MAVRYYTDDCRYRLPQKRLTAQWHARGGGRRGLHAGRRELHLLLGAAPAGDEPPVPRARLLHRRHHLRLQRPPRDDIVSGTSSSTWRPCATMRASSGRGRLRRCAAWWCTACCTSADRATRRPGPMRRCTARRIVICVSGRLTALRTRRRRGVPPAPRKKA